MAQQINVPGVGIVNFPDGMSDQDIAAAIQRNHPEIHPQQQGSVPVDPENKAAMARASNPEFDRTAQAAFGNHATNKMVFSQMPRLQGLLSGGNYDQTKADADALLAQQEADHPIASTAGNVVGDTVPYLVNPGAGFLGKAAFSAGVGAAQGAGNTAGNIDFANESAKQAALKELIGAGVGGVAGAVGEGVGTLAHSAAVRMAPSAIGAMKSIVNKLSSGAKRDLGEYLITPGGENGVTTQVLKPWNGVHRMLEANKLNMDTAGGANATVRNAVDANGNTFDTMAAATDVEGLRPRVPTAPINRGSSNAVNDAQESILEHGAQIGDTNGRMSLADANELKGKYGEVSNWKPMQASEIDPNTVAKGTYQLMRKRIRDSIAQDLATQGATPAEVAETMRRYDLNDSVYTSGSTAKSALTNLENQEYGNNQLGFSSKVAAGALAGGGNPIGALGAMGAIELGNRLLPKTIVYGLDKASRSKLGLFPQITNAIDQATQNGEDGKF